MKNEKLKLLAIASIGAHWIQLLRITKTLNDEFEVVYMSTHPKCETMLSGQIYYTIPDFSRRNFYKLFPAFFRTMNIIKKENPSTVITTGAAPGLITLMAAKLLRRKTIWVDSIANVEKLSLSGKIASKFATRAYTQWPELAAEKIIYAGNVLS